MAEEVGNQTISQSLINVKKGIFTCLVWAVCLGTLAILTVRIAVRFATPPAPHRLVFVQDIPLPGALPDSYRTKEHPLAPGVAVLFDHFDFQVLDPRTHLLFIAHSGPSPDREQQVNPHFDPDTDAKNDGNIVVFDTVQKKVVGLLNIPQVAGITLASDLQKVYAADSYDNIVYAINEHTLRAIPIELQENDRPDSLGYDQSDHLIFVSDAGAPANPEESKVIDQENQNETIINVLTDQVIARIPLGVDGEWGDNVGHVRFDSGLHRAFVVVQQLSNPDDPNPNVLPPPGTAWLVEIEPLARLHPIVTRLKLPYACITPHGMAIDTEQHIAFIACINETPPSLVRVDLQTMQVIAEAPWPLPARPDILALDRPLHLLYVACETGIAIFQIDGRSLKWLANYIPGVNTHTIAVNEETHEVYVPLVRVGNRPVLRILRYNPNG